jgi:transcriptional regulator with XRE-family HTH domain
MEVGDIRGMLAIARKARGITQKELAERCGLAEVTIRQYETGRRFPNAETLKRITKELHVKIVVIPERKLGGE